MTRTGEPLDPGPPAAAGDRPTDLVVPPTRLGGRRASRPGIALAVVLVAFVAVAIWKPWASGPIQPGPRPSAPPVAQASAGPSASPGSSGVPSVYGPVPSPERLLAASSVQNDWGVRAIAIRPGGPLFAGQIALDEHWTPMDRTIVYGSPEGPAVTIGEPDDAVVALGITTSPDALPLDLRFWELVPGEGPRRLAPVAIPGPEAGSWLWLPDPARVTEAGSWPGGSYEVEVLTGPRILRVVVTLPSTLPAVDDGGPPIIERPLAAALAPLPVGPFAIADGGPFQLEGGTPPVATEHDAWLAAALGQAPPAQVAARATTAFGAVLESGWTADSIAVRQLAQRTSGIEVTTDLVTALRLGRSAIVARPVEGGIFGSGLYLLAVESHRGSETRTERWAVEVVAPGTSPTPGSALDDLASWAQIAASGRDPGGAPVVVLPHGVARDSCLPSIAIRADEPFFGVVPPPGWSIQAMRLREADTPGADDVAIRYAAQALPGLAVVATPRGGLLVHDHDLSLTLVSASGSRDITQRICIR